MQYIHFTILCQTLHKNFKVSDLNEMPPAYPPEKTCIKNEIGYHGENIAADTENTGGIQMEPKLTIVIPIYNEAESLEEILRLITNRSGAGAPDLQSGSAR